MRRIETEVLVIGGGATGTGVLRDLAMRGFRALLVEKGDLASGTTGRYHGLLHSGGRYAVKDPLAARECIQENAILRRILPHCIEDTGGYFVQTPWDDPQYAEQFILGCRQAQIPLEEAPVGKMLAAEPLLNRRITRCFHVPDAAADSFLAAQSNLASAREYGASCLTYHQVTGLLMQRQTVVGARLVDLVTGEELEVLADMTVNASGAWAGKICALAGLSLEVAPGKGSMLALNQRIVHTVVNRCKMPSDGDILVPIHSVTVIGTTDVRVADPDRFAIEPWEVQLMLDEGEKLIPGFRQLRILRLWAGVRPLVQENGNGDSRDLSRAYVLLDHQQRDGLQGLVTITSGKWTTYRKMAEVTVDLVCRKLGVSRPCRTALEALPETRLSSAQATTSAKQLAPRTAVLCERLAEVETEGSYGLLVCECELATVADVRAAILDGGAQSIDDIRRLVRLGMGPCQGGYCTYRAAGLLHELCRLPVESVNNALHDFLLERWKGLLPVLWGTQLRQERLDELIYRSLLNAAALPGLSATAFTPVFYDPPSVQPETPPATDQQEYLYPEGSDMPPTPTQSSDVIVIGGGLAGLFAACQAASRGRRVRLLTHGLSSLYFHSGCIDVLGYYPPGSEEPLRSPAEGLQQLMASEPAHPYSLAGETAIAASLEILQATCRAAGYPLLGTLERNWLLPTALGSWRPTCLAPETMTAGDASRAEPVWVIGFEGFMDFCPTWIAANLEAQGWQAYGLKLELPNLRARKIDNSRLLAELLDAGELQQEIITAIRKELASAPPFAPARLAFPAALGLRFPLRVLTELQQGLDLPVFEIPTLPPSIPGMRLAAILENALRSLGASIQIGAQVVTAEVAPSGDISRVWSQAAVRRQPHSAGVFLLATGGILGGGITTGSRGEVDEAVFGLPLEAPGEHSLWFEPVFLSAQGHPIFRSGISVDEHFQPVNQGRRVLYPNLYVAGAALGNCDPLVERSLEGLALASAYAAGKRL